jgi:hypothetical protein
MFQETWPRCCLISSFSAPGITSLEGRIGPSTPPSMSFSWLGGFLVWTRTLATLYISNYIVLCLVVPANARIGDFDIITYLFFSYLTLP